MQFISDPQSDVNDLIKELFPNGKTNIHKLSVWNGKFAYETQFLVVRNIETINDLKNIHNFYMTLDCWSNDDSSKEKEFRDFADSKYTIKGDRCMSFRLKDGYIHKFSFNQGFANTDHVLYNFNSHDVAMSAYNLETFKSLFNYLSGLGLINNQ